MRILVIDAEAMGLDFVLRCTAAGHEVRWYIYSTKPTRDGEGFPGFRIVPDWREHMTWVGKDGLIVTTGNWRFLYELDRFRDLGYKVFSPTVASARLEINREAGMKAMQAAGIELPPYQTFVSIEAAARFARRSDRAWVFKPMGDESDKSLTYVADDPADLVGWLERQIAAGKKLKGSCMLQEKVEMLCEIGVSGWVGPEGFLEEKWQVCFEHKKLMDGEIGPSTGEQGTLCFYTETDKLADEMLKPMEPVLRALGHRGDFAVGACVDTKGRAWPFEFTARLGWPAFFIQMASHRGDPAKWMRDVLDGKDSLRVSYDAAIGVVMAQPRYPYAASLPELVEGNPISGIDDIGDQAHLVSVMRGRGPVMADGKVVNGQTYQTTDELVMVVTGLGKTIERARDKVYAAVERVRFPNRMYRTDIGCKVAAVLDKLHRFGYAVDLG